MIRGDDVVRIDMSDAEMEVVCEVGRRRQGYAEDNNCREQRDLEYEDAQPHIIGCLGELAAAKALDTEWLHNVGTLKAPDLKYGDINIEVRSRLCSTGRDLLLKPKDRENQDRPFVLVHVYRDYHDKIIPIARVMGWIIGRDGMVKKYWRRLNGFDERGACFVDWQDLRPIAELKELLRRGSL